MPKSPATVCRNRFSVYSTKKTFKARQASTALTKTRQIESRLVCLPAGSSDFVAIFSASDIGTVPIVSLPRNDF